ncbi:MAG: hypothetical protein C0469_12090 [Cyanobacteria bacterium DS2.3.42]|nr:hypothetical protein [Cyanobacteria bacterium DS2.3.42]
MRKLKTSAVLVVACLIPVHLLACQPSAFAVQSKWRKLSRHARILVDDNDYRNAVEYYGKAITELQNTEPHSECLYDLVLNLAETYILARAYYRAGRVLDRIEPEITSKVFSDPLLPVRFWRRKSELYYQQRDLPRSIECSITAFNIFGNNFVHSDELYQGQLRKLILMLCESGNWKQVASYAHMLKMTEMTQGPEYQKNFYLPLRNSSLTAMLAGDLESSRQILGALSYINPQDKELVTLKNQWSALDSKIKNVPELREKALPKQAPGRSKQ